MRVGIFSKKHNQEMQEKEKIARGTYRLFIPIG
jgi:hypothetical protein